MGSIELNKVSKKFNNRYILKDISYNFYDSNVYLIYGETGVGKSTLVSLIYNKDKFEGSVNYNNLNKEDFSFDIKNDLIESFTGIENLKLVTNDINKIEYISKKLKIYDLLDKKVSSYSNGEYQRLSFARIVLIDKPVMILDEPTSCLDYGNKKIIYDYLYSIKNNRIIIIVSHDYTDDRFISLEMKSGHLIENSCNLKNDNKLHKSDYKFRLNFSSWINLTVSNVKTNYFKIIVLSLITILITVISFCSTSIKDDREELVNYCHQTQDFSTSNILEADYYNTYVNGNHYVFNEDDSLDMSKHTNGILNEQVKDYYCNSIIHIDAIELFNNIDKLSCNQYFNTKDTVDLKYDEVELELYNIKDVDVNRYIGKNIESKYSILSNFKFVVKNIVTFCDDTYDRIIIKVSNEFKNYLEDNYISLNFKLYNGYIDNSNITKDNIFKYQTLKDQFDDEYIKYEVYRGSIIFNAFLIIISGVSIYIIYYGIYKNMVHSKTILESLGANKYNIYSFFGFFCLIYFVMLIIGISIFIINKSFINQRISEILKVDIETIKFNYIILIEIIFSFVISIIISLKKYSIFRIEKIN